MAPTCKFMKWSICYERDGRNEQRTYISIDRCEDIIIKAGISYSKKSYIIIIPKLKNNFSAQSPALPLRTAGWIGASFLNPVGGVSTPYTGVSLSESLALEGTE